MGPSKSKHLQSPIALLCVHECTILFMKSTDIWCSPKNKSLLTVTAKGTLLKRTLLSVGQLRT